MKRFIIDKVSVATRLPGMRLGQIALATALTFAMGCALLPQAAQADSAAIWGRQTASGKFQTKKVTLNSASTITAVRYDGGGDGFCIWSGVPSAKSILCWKKGSASLVGTVLPAGAGYFIIPAKRTPNSSAYAQVRVK